MASFRKRGNLWYYRFFDEHGVRHYWPTRVRFWAVLGTEYRGSVWRTLAEFVTTARHRAMSRIRWKTTLFN
jgi:hypothetical protein